MDALRVLGLIREGLGSNLWGIGCPIHCHPTSFTALALSFLLGLLAGSSLAAYLGFRLGLFHLQPVPGPSPSAEPSFRPASLRLRGYVHAQD